MMVKEVLEERLLRGKKRSAACWTCNASDSLTTYPKWIRSGEFLCHVGAEVVPFWAALES